MDGDLKKTATKRDEPTAWFRSPVLVLHLISSLIAFTIMAIFPILSFTAMPIPATYSLKVTQQTVNVLIALAADAFVQLLSYCLGYVAVLCSGSQS